MDGVLLQLPNLDPAARWWLIIAASLTIIYAIMRPLRRKKDPLERLSKPASLATQRAVERDMSHLLVEMSEMARQITAQLDTRASKLELLIKQADQRLAALGSALPGLTTLRLTDSGGERNSEGGPGIDPRHAEVYVLADQGHSAHAIAQRLERPYGEIELILALREKSAAL